MDLPLTKATATLAVCGASVLLWRFLRRRREASHVTALIAASAAAYRTKQYEEAQDNAFVACEYARTTPALGEASESHRLALLHLASVQHAMNQSEHAHETLEQCAALTRQLYGEDSRALLPVLHAQAEICECCELWADATAALEAACRIRSDGDGDDAARGAFNFSQALALEAVEAKSRSSG